MHVFHPHVLIPAENLLVGMLRLVGRRIPVESIENARFGILLPVHRKYMMDRAGHRFADQRHAPYPPLEVVEERDGNFQDSMQSFRLHTACITPPDITEAVP